MVTTESIRRIKMILIPIIIALVVLRIGMMALSADNGMRYLLRHGIYTVTWGAVAYFLFFCSLILTKKNYEPEEIIKMRKVSYWAMIACILRVIVSTIHNWPLVSYAVWPTLHNILEQVIWLLFAAFFYKYWKIRKKQTPEDYF